MRNGGQLALNLIGEAKAAIGCCDFGNVFVEHGFELF
jgi:hypothetical protein